jgi:hypothetical protein
MGKIKSPGRGKIEQSNWGKRRHVGSSLAPTMVLSIVVISIQNSTDTRAQLMAFSSTPSIPD